MATTATKDQPKTPAQRKALAKKIAADKKSGMSGMDMRAKYGAWLSGPARRALLREFGHTDAIAPSYDRDEARKRREAAAAKAK